MSKSISTILFLILLGLPILAQQEKTPELPDYTKWELSEWEFQTVLYRGNPSHILGAIYQKDADDRTVLVYSKLMSEEKYRALKSLSLEERFKTVNLIMSKAPLFIGYFVDGESSHSINFYELSRRWFEVYKLWQPKPRFVKRVPSHSHSQFIEQRYGLKFIE